MTWERGPRDFSSIVVHYLRKNNFSDAHAWYAERTSGSRAFGQDSGALQSGFVPLNLLR